MPRLRLSFLDERDDQPRAPRPPRRPPPRGPSTDPQTLLVRRAIAVGGGLLVLLLLFFGIRGCQASQKEQGFKDYVSDADELVAESEQQSAALFELLENPGSSEVDFTSNVNGIKVQAEQLVERADDIDVPDELRGANGDLVEALEFRRDGLDGIAREAAGATGEPADGAADEDEGDPNERIAAQMQFFLTSDVIYSQRFLPELLGETRGREPRRGRAGAGHAHRPGDDRVPPRHRVAAAADGRRQPGRDRLGGPTRRPRRGSTGTASAA